MSTAGDPDHGVPIGYLPRWSYSPRDRLDVMCRARNHGKPTSSGCTTATLARTVPVCARLRLEYYGVHALEVAHQIVRLDDVTQLHGFGAGGRGGALISLANSPTTVLAETILTNLEPPTPSFDPPAHAVAYGSKGHARWAATDTPLATLGLVTAFVDMARTGVPPLPPTEGLALANLALDLTTAAVSAQPVQH